MITRPPIAYQVGHHLCPAHQVLRRLCRSAVSGSGFVLNRLDDGTLPRIPARLPRPKRLNFAHVVFGIEILDRFLPFKTNININGRNRNTHIAYVMLRFSYAIARLFSILFFQSFSLGTSNPPVLMREVLLHLLVKNFQLHGVKDPLPVFRHFEPFADNSAVLNPQV